MRPLKAVRNIAAGVSWDIGAWQPAQSADVEGAPAHHRCRHGGCLTSSFERRAKPRAVRRTECRSYMAVHDSPACKSRPMNGGSGVGPVAIAVNPPQVLAVFHLHRPVVEAGVSSSCST